MRTALVALAAAVLTLGAGTAASESSAPTKGAPLYGLTYSGGAAVLSRYDAGLRPVGPRLRLPDAARLWAFSPDGSQLALASEKAGLQLVDLRRMRIRARMSGRRLVYGLAWVAPRRILLAEHGETLVVDPVGPRILRREYRTGSPSQAQRTRDGLVLLGAPDEGIGPARLDVVGGDGRTRTVAVDRIRVGVDGDGSDPGQWQVERPGLAVDPAGNRAFLVGADGLVAEVDLGTLAVAYRAGRLPQARRKFVSGATRTAAWLGGVLAISGYDTSYDGAGREAQRPYGLRLFDPATGGLRMLDERALSLTTAAGLALASGEGGGLSAYGPDGAMVWRLFEGVPAASLGVAGGEAYVSAAGRLHAVELATGRVRMSKPETGTVVFLTRGP
jgi:hypothetical protein